MDLFGAPFWSSAELAEVFGISPQRLGVLCKTGVLPLPTNGLHDPKAVVTAYVRHLKQRDENRSKDGEAVRKIQLENEIRTIKLQRIAGELVPVDRVQADWFEATRQVRDGLLNLPSRLSGVFAAESSQEKIFEAFTKEVHAVLTNLAREQAWQPAEQSGSGLTPPAPYGEEESPADGRNQDRAARTLATDDEPIADGGERVSQDDPEARLEVANTISRRVISGEQESSENQAERFSTGD